MRHAVLVVLALVCSVPVWGQQLPWIFYDDFESGDTSGWWAPARVSETGQKKCYDQAGNEIFCAGTGQDGDIRPGVAWPSPRFVDNANGTVTDMLTGLVWLRNANCFATTWMQALGDANTLASGSCGLTDGSVAGDWRLPSVNELQSLVDYEYDWPALSNAAGTGHWNSGDAFSGVQPNKYWSASSCAFGPWYAWFVDLSNGEVKHLNKTFSFYVWPVRGGL